MLPMVFHFEIFILFSKLGSFSAVLGKHIKVLINPIKVTYTALWGNGHFGGNCRASNS